jgi:hypothetical protein
MVKCQFLTFHQISGYPVIIERRIRHHSIRLGEMILMSYRSFSYDHWIPRYSAKRQMAQYRKCKKCRFLTFCQISRHPMIIESRIRHHSIRPVETILMSYRSSSYDRWLPRYSTKLC